VTAAIGDPTLLIEPTLTKANVKRQLVQMLHEPPAIGIKTPHLKTANGLNKTKVVHAVPQQHGALKITAVMMPREAMPLEVILATVEPKITAALAVVTVDRVVAAEVLVVLVAGTLVVVLDAKLAN
jgi:predicted LPLAT superfamily acyltransferase